MRRTGNRREFTRRDFLKLAGAGAMGVTGLSLLGSQAYRSLNGQRQGAPEVKNVQMGDSGMNVVVVVLDTMRQDHVGAYGNGWIRTPNIDALAKDSLRFTRAYPESMPTICARRAIHTGMRTWPFRNYAPPQGTSVFAYGWQPIPEEQVTLAEILGAAGYETLLVTDTFHQLRPSMNFQRGFKVFDFIRGQEEDRYHPTSMAPQEKMKATLVGLPERNVEGKMRQYFANTTERTGEEDYFAPQVFTRAASFLEGLGRQGKPFFMVVDSFDPHEPWDPPKKYVDLYSDGYDGLEPYASVYGPADYLSGRELERMQALYAAEVTMTDRWLGTFLDEMESLGLMENTAVLLLGDHGHLLGEQDTVGKLSKGLWPALTDVPFFIRHPGGKGAGETSDYYASTHDVAPTVLGLLGVEPPVPFEGQNLSVLLDGEEPGPRSHFTLGYNNHVLARDGEYAMISRNDGTEAKLYDLKADPRMEKDLAAKHPKVTKRMFDEYVLKDAGGPLPTY